MRKLPAQAGEALAADAGVVFEFDDQSAAVAGPPELFYAAVKLRL